MLDTDAYRPGPMGLERGLDLLELLAESSEAVSFSDAQRLTGLAKPVLSRLFKSLCARELVVRDPATRRYGRGPGLIRLARGMEWAPHSRKALAHAAQPQLERLMHRFQQTVMAVHWGGRCLESVATATAEDGLAAWPIGTRRDHYQRGPWGWIVLAETGEDPAERCAGDDKAPPVAEVRDGIDQVRAQGLAALRRGHVWRLAAPVRARGGQLVGAIGCFVNPAALSADDHEALEPDLKQAASAISHRLGHTAAGHPQEYPA